MTVELKGQFILPIYFDLGATFLYALSGALVAIRRNYDIVGLFVLALVTGLGGGLIRDSIFIQNGPPLAMQDERYLYVVLAGCVVAAAFSRRIDRLQKVFLLADALGLGAYAVVGVEKCLNAGLSVVAAIMVGVINASGGGLLRDVLVREEPLLFKPGQLYVLGAVLGACLFTWMLMRLDWSFQKAGLMAVGATFVFRLLAIIFNWKTVSVAERMMPVSISLSMTGGPANPPTAGTPTATITVKPEPPPVPPPPSAEPPPGKV
ncbi:MAG TPA: trimeric intracellular cation channel family protein [Candidatus Acidoferrum sp.]|nr:trimeric intracellular cation channel family protein [Candidatus Acidoferrum sp.]